MAEADDKTISSETPSSDKSVDANEPKRPPKTSGAGTDPPPGGAVTGVAGSGGTRGSRFDVAYGIRPMKAYPITENELGQLAVIGGGALFCFTLGAGLFGFSLEVVRDLAMSPGLSSDVVATWETFGRYAKNFSFGSFVVGGVLLLLRRDILKKIKDETVFDEAGYGTR